MMNRVTPTHRNALLPLTAALFTALLVFPAAVLADEPTPTPEPVPSTASASPTPAVTTSAPEVKPPEPERISGKIHKIDLDEKSVTLLVQQGRAFKRYKVIIDEKSLILDAQGQPSTINAIEQGFLVEIGYFEKGKQKVADTIVIAGKE